MQGAGLTLGEFTARQSRYNTAPCLDGPLNTAYTCTSAPPAAASSTLIADFSLTEVVVLFQPSLDVAVFGSLTHLLCYDAEEDCVEMLDVHVRWP